MSGKENQRFKEKSYLRHPLCCQSETDSDGGEEALRYVRHNDPDKEDDSVEPVVAEDEGDDEEADAKEDSDGGDDVDEVLDLLGDGGLPTLQTRCESSDSSHDCVVSDVDDHPNAGPLHGVGREEGKVSRLKGVLRCKRIGRLKRNKVSRGNLKLTSFVNSGLLVCGSDSPVSEELST